MIFLFEQKTAYEMRISDWSSDVCSSDLSTQSSTPIFASRWIKAGSIGEIPPSTRVRPGAASAMASPVSFAISAKSDHSGSISGSQCDLLFGSFQILAASIMQWLTDGGRQVQSPKGARRLGKDKLNLWDGPRF